MKKMFLIFCVFFLLVCCSSDSKFDAEKDGNMLREVCELLPPPESHQLEERDIFRPHAGTISKFYSHELGCPAVENHYEGILRERGWEMVPRSYFRNPDNIYFKKGDVSISVFCSESRDLWGIKDFSIACSKGLR